jgi:gamma-glutamylcysteine synthetase
MAKRSSARRHRKVSLRRSVDDVVDLYKKFPRARSEDLRCVGMEDELLVVRINDGKTGEALVLIAMLVELDWQPVYDVVHPELLIAAKHEELGMVTVDAGIGTLEWNSIPTNNLYALKEMRIRVIGLLASLAAKHNWVILGTGRHPVTRGSANILIPKDRYGLFLKRYGTGFHDLAVGASQQVHIEARGRRESIEMTNDFMALSAVVTAMSANSPYFSGNKLRGLVSSRVSMWKHYDPKRTGIARRPYANIVDFCNQLWEAEYIVGPDDIGGYRLYGYPFRELFRGRRMSDECFARHFSHQLGTWWFEARPRPEFKTVEARTPCQQPPGMGVAFPSLYMGWAEEPDGRRDLVKSVPWTAWVQGRFDASQFHLKAKIGKYKLHELAIEGLRVASTGLKKRKNGPEHLLLDPLHEVVQTRKHPPAIDQIHAREQGLDKLLEMFSYRAVA